jgi:hypothetical protein
MAIGRAIGASERNRELAHVKIRQRRRGSMRHGLRRAQCFMSTSCCCRPAGLGRLVLCSLPVPWTCAAREIKVGNWPCLLAVLGPARADGRRGQRLKTVAIRRRRRVGCLASRYETMTLKGDS